MEVAPNQNEVYQNIREITLTARQGIKRTVEFSMVQAYWQIGRQIMDAQGGENRAEYGTQLLKFLAERLTVEFGVSFDETNLRKMRQFYSIF